ncbi:hypothetical protein [Paraburkholderia caribensis]|uniref:hypothetical protein n=1 Tax=Paraburkholderia caribensis TaxID=75105 RepID=UPI0020901068|nr:hypothetical protein [Paraburkholderia caribensis]MCO4880233.1 hypothetical protein [Paraburkholderia caribensis]
MAAADAILQAWAPSDTETFSFQVVLTNFDLTSETHTLSTRWNAYAANYQVVLQNSNSDEVLRVPMVGSPDAYDIPLTAGRFLTSVLFRTSTQNFEISNNTVTGSKPGFNGLGTLVARPQAPDAGSLTSDLVLDGSWDLDGSQTLNGVKVQAT